MKANHAIRGKPKKKQQTLDATLSKTSSTAKSRPSNSGESFQQCLPPTASTRAKNPSQTRLGSGQLTHRPRFMATGFAAKAGGRQALSDSEGHDLEEHGGNHNASDSGITPPLVTSGETDEDSDDVPLAAPSSSLRQRRRARPVVSDEGTSDDSQPRPLLKRRRLVRKTSWDDEQDANEEKEEDEEERAPMSTSTPRTPTSGGCLRAVRSGPRSGKRKQLELLRRRRRGEDIEEVTSSSNEEHLPLYDTDPENPALDEFEDEEDEVIIRGEKHLRKAKENGSRSEKDQDDMDDFIIDDDDGPLGAPLLNTIPLELTAQAHKPMKAHFKDAIEWLVQRRINPSFNRNDPVYVRAWRRLDDEFTGLAQSKFSSSAWTPNFYQSLRTHPYIDTFPAKSGSLGDLLNKCQACNRTNHPATRRIRFAGTPYNRETLEDLETDSDEGDGDQESGDDGSNPRSSEDGREWFVGTVCASNAETAHDLYHWKHSLKDWVEDHLKSLGLLDADKLAEREQLSVGKRRKMAIKLVDEWDAKENGVIKGLYGDFKRTLENARNKSTTGSRKRRQ